MNRLAPKQNGFFKWLITGEMYSHKQIETTICEYCNEIKRCGVRSWKVLGDVIQEYDLTEIDEVVFKDGKLFEVWFKVSNDDALVEKGEDKNG